MFKRVNDKLKTLKGLYPKLNIERISDDMFHVECCDCKYTYDGTYDTIINYNGCKMCQLNKLFSKRNYTLTECKEYNDYSDRITYCCNICNHSYETTIRNALYSKCKYCSMIEKLNNLDYEYVDEKHIKCCRCDTIFEKTYRSLMSDEGKKDYRACPTCKEKQRLNQVNQVTHGEYELIRLVDNNTILMKHNACGHTWEVGISNFFHLGSRCPKCAWKISKNELLIHEMIENLYKGEIIYNSRDIIPPYELDIYIPEKKVAIEYNGTYFHSSLYKDADYHYNKSSACEERGIRLIHIWEYEWINERQRPILENIIKSALGVIEEKIPARKCNVIIKESSEMREFFDKNNIQGFRPGKFAICLEYNNEIVMSYMMGSAFFGKGKYEWEVIRGATKLGTTVVGGASKLWKYFIDNYEPKSCVYYIDYNYFNGNSVEKLGLKYVSSQSSYKNYWVETNTIKNREPQRHKEIKELEKQGLVIPIYNAGTKVYLYENKV